MKHAWDQPLGIWNVAVHHPDLPAVVASPSGITLTFAELAGRAHQVVHALRANGISTGDIVAYALPNDVNALYWQLACQEGGYQAIALNPALSGSEIRTIVDHSGADAVVVDHAFADRVDELEGTGSIRLRVVVDGTLDGWTGFEDLVAGRPESPPADRVLGIPISYSSGTTGKPKAIVRPSMPQLDPTVMADQMKTFGHAFRFQPFVGAHLISAGMHHGGCQSFYLGALHVGQAVAIMGKFDAERTLQMIEQHRITTAYMVPTQFVRLLRLPDDVRHIIETLRK